MISSSRFRAALRATALHLSVSLIVALFAASVVFGVWYAYPYREISGGRELFWLVVVVDVICGPLLTMVLFNPAKPRVELWWDLALVALVQLGALGYGLHTVWEARPLFLVHNVDRFTVIALPDLAGASFAGLSKKLHPAWLSGPVTVAIRAPVDEAERQMVMTESIQGGRDYAQRPEFYVSYEGATAKKSLQRAKPLSVFLQKHPAQEYAAKAVAAEKGAVVAHWYYLPVTGRQDWVAILDKQGQIQGFLKGDGF